MPDAAPGYGGVIALNRWTFWAPCNDGTGNHALNCPQPFGRIQV